jgi:hypothetical protein
MPLASRRLSNSSKEAFDEFCTKNQPLSRRLSNSSDIASMAFATNMQSGKEKILKKRLSLSSIASTTSSRNKRSQPSKSSTMLKSAPKVTRTGKPKSATSKTTTSAGMTTPKSKKARTAAARQEGNNNKENGGNDEEVFQSPTPYWKVAMERGGTHSPRETRAAKKRRTTTGKPFFENGGPNTNQNRDGLLMFSPPDQVANAKREEMELERKTRER